MDNKSLIDSIYQQLECKELLTKEIIEEFLKDIQLFDKKQGDYGPQNISKFGVIGVLVRSSDKIERLINLYKTSTLKETTTPIMQVQDETVENTWADLSVYGAIARTLDKGKWGHNEQSED